MSNPVMSHHKIALARQMRAEPTAAEARLWNSLRAWPAGPVWVRQLPMLGYIADFYCPAHRVVVEVDGGVHQNQDQIEHDHLRDQVMFANGLRVVRFRNEEVEHDLPSVLHTIWGVL